MEGKYKYPILEISRSKVRENAKRIVQICNEKGISVSGVVKGFNALPQLVEVFIEAGCHCIADARMDHIVMMRQHGVSVPLMLLRIPMMCELEEIAAYADISLHSEKAVLDELERICERQKKMHKVILMMDVGDLREGIFDEEELIKLAVYVERNLEHVVLGGIGTNIGCYGGIAPTAENIGKLVETAGNIESQINRSLEMISGGATSSLTLIMDDTMPKGVNHLRIGEGILLGRDLQDLWGYNMDYLHKDAFILKAQIIEVKRKPSHPIGNIMVDAFGNKPVFQDIGIRKRALAAVGKQDIVLYDKLIPRVKGIEVLGASSDHLILDIENCSQEIHVGDILEFEMFYPPLLYLSGSPMVTKIFVD